MSVNDDVEQCMFPVVHGEDHETAMNKVSTRESAPYSFNSRWRRFMTNTILHLCKLCLFILS